MVHTLNLHDTVRQLYHNKSKFKNYWISLTGMRKGMHGGKF